MEYIPLLPPSRGDGAGSGFGSEIGQTLEAAVAWSLQNRTTLALVVVGAIGAYLLLKALVRG